jgi:folate-binding protein YgfZ
VAAPGRFARPPAVLFGLMGPQAAETLGRAGAELPAEMALEDHVTAALAGRPVRIARAGDLPAGGWVIHASPEDAAAIRGALVAAGATPIGGETLDVLRIEDGRPWYGADIGEEHLLHETGLVAEYHSSAKGCYVGQEVVARLEARGAHVNKVLRRLRLEAPVARGAVVQAEGKDVGRVTTAGVSPANGPIAMAFVHRSAAAAGTAVTVDGRSALVEVLAPLA